MSGVVLRCPNCGTTRGAPGECEACHEAQVRYYCTNHTPGRWLDGPACSQCGAAFGERPRPRAPAPAPAAPAPTARPRPASRPFTRPGPGRTTTRGSGRFPPAPDEAFPSRDEHFGRAPSLQELLLEALRARHVPPPEPLREREPSTRGRGPGGCLLRFMLLLFFLFLAMMSGLFVFASSWLQLFRLW
jgi:hypothetical protein